MLEWKRQRADNFDLKSYRKMKQLSSISAKVSSFLHGHPFIVDLGYEISHREQIYSLIECKDIYGLNGIHSEGFHLHFTSINKQDRFYSEFREGLFDTYLADFHEKPFWEIFPKEKLVYLAPDAPKLKRYKADNIYVLGGLLDFSHEHSSFSKARDIGIQSGSLPLTDFGW